MSGHKGKINSNLNGYLRFNNFEKTTHTATELKKFLIEKIKMEPNDEPYVCATFGCGRKLTLHEQLYGNLCFPCQKLEKIDINTIIKHFKAI